MAIALYDCVCALVFACPQAQGMARNAFQFVQDNLLPEHQYCYLASLLKVMPLHVGFTCVYSSGRLFLAGLYTYDLCTRTILSFTGVC